MNDLTRSALAELNRTFYAEFADDFARTRRGWPPGFDRILPYLGPAANVLDVGCGNGRLLAFLTERGWRGHYIGVDSSAGLLAVAATYAETGRFVHADVLDPEWVLQLNGSAYDAIACLAVLHHIPGASHRARLIAECTGLLRPGGSLILSTWQFFNTPRLRERVLPWATAGLRDEDVEPGDYLVTWGARAAGRRYCAAITRETLCTLAAKAGLAPVETFYADGHEGNLNLYGVFIAR
jgi:tRNA (uracil-5-)-methyltransferase TRM9